METRAPPCIARSWRFPMRVTTCLLALAVTLLACSPAWAAGSATFWVDANRGGSSFTMTEGQWDHRLRDRGFNDVITSYSTTAVDVTLYDNDDYGGAFLYIGPNQNG